MGQPLPSSSAADSAALDSAQATAESSPRTAAFSPVAKSSISFFATAPSQLPSGISIEASFGETYNLLGGKDPVLIDRPAQDFVLYAYPAASNEQPNRLGAFFIAKPTRTNFSIAELFNANVHVEIRSGRQNKLGALIDNRGGGLRAGDGSQLLIPADAVSGSQSVFFDNVSLQSAGVTLPAGYEVLAAFDVDLGSTSLNSAATISVPGLTGDMSRVVVAQLITVGGQRSPKVVARAIVDGDDKLTSTTTIPPLPAGVALRGIRSTGRYVFIRVPSAFGYVKGTITDAATSAPQSMVRVSNNQTPFVDVTGNDGQYVLVGVAGTAPDGVNQIGAAALSTDATGTATAQLNSQDAVANSNIALSAVALQVESITPASGAQNMIATTPVTVTFNKPIAAQTLTGSSFTLSTDAGNPVLGNITVLAGNRVVVFTPAATLAASTKYKVSLTTAVRDIYGHNLGAAFNSTFTTAATVVISNRLKPEQITISYPDTNGISTVSIPGGSVPNGSTILVVNNTNGSTISTTAGSSTLNLQIEALVGDEIALTISQPDGTQYRVVQAAYRRADGFVSVGSNGGTVTSDNGQVLLSIPAGAIQGQADLKLTTTTESDITIPRTGMMDPANVPFGAGVRITATGNFTNTQELHLEVAAPPTVIDGQRVAFMKASKFTEGGVERDVWEVVSSGKVEGGKFKTMSPPFIGVTIVSTLGIYDVQVFVPRSFRGVTGTVTEKVNAGGTKPLPGVFVFVTGANQNESRTVMARSAFNGQFGVLDFAVGSSDTVIVDAIDSLNRTQTAVATPFLGFSPTAYPGLNGLTSMFTSVVFPSSEGLPETLPALLRTEGQMLDLEDGQVDTLQAFGRVGVGSHVQVKVHATPDVATITGRLMVSGAVRRELIWRNPNPGSGSYETDFTVDGEGAYTVAVTTHTQANVETTKATTNFSFIGLSNPNTRPSIPGAPFVLNVTPRDQAAQVDSGTRVHLEFSEPVKNLVAGTSVYLTEQGSSTPLSGTILSGGIPVGANTPNISTIDFIPTRGLKGGKTYTVHVTTAVLDSDSDHLDQTPEDLDLKPFTSTFTTFEGLVITTEPPTDQAFRIAAAGELAATVTTDFATSSGSTLTVYDMSDPQHPKAVSQTFVPQRAIGIAMAELAPEDKFAGAVSPTTIIAITTISHPDLDRANNLWIYSVDAPEKPERIGVVSLAFPRQVSEFPANITLKHKRAYIGNTGTGGLLVVDLEAAVQRYTEVGATAATLKAILPLPSQGFATDTQRQKAKYGGGPNVSAPIMAASVIDQVTLPNQPAEPVAYVVGNKPQLISFRLGESFDGRLNFLDTPPQKGFDDRVVAKTDLIPEGYAVDLRAVSKVFVGGMEKDLTLMLGQTRLWIYDVTNPFDPQYLSSPLFTDLGGPSDYARRIEVEDTLAYIMFSDRVVVIDFHDPANPTIASTITGIGTNLRWITVKDGFVYTLSGEGKLNVSIGRAASLVLVHGYDASATQTCGNPVVIDRQTRHMAQPAEVFFQVFGHDVPQNPKVIIRKTVFAGDQSQDTTLATLPVNLSASIPNVVVGSAIWQPISDPIDPAATYTAEVVLDESGSNEFHSRREAIPFSFLIDQYQQSFGVTSGQTQFAYLLGGDATIDFKIDNKDVLTSAGETRGRNFGSNQERTSTASLPGTIVFNPPLATGTYAFTLRATLNANSSVSDEVQGFVTVDANRFDARLPGSTVVNGVELSTGNLGLSVNDLTIPHRGLSLSVIRSYNSAGRNSFNPFGYGWRHNYQVTLQHVSGENGAPGLFMMIGGEGSGQIFNEATIQATGRAAAESPYQGTLTKVADGFDYFTKGHVKYHFTQAMDAGTEAFFDFGYMGNLNYIEEPNGNRITLSYDAEGRMVRAQDQAGRALTYEYSVAETPLVGSIEVVQNAASCQSKARLGIMRRRFLQASVGKAWHITRIAGPGGVEIEYEYDPTDGNLTGVKRLAGDAVSQPVTQNYVWSYEYNPTPQANPIYDHLLKSVTSPNSAVASGHKTTYEYRLDQFGQPVGSIQMPEGVKNTYNYTFGGSGNQITQAVVTDGLLQARTYEIDRGRVVRILEPRGAVTVLAWNDRGNKTLEIDPKGRQTATHYDGNGNPDSQTVTGGSQTITVSAVFDPKFGKPISITDGNRNTTTYSLDSRGNVTRVLQPNGREIRMDYAANGDLQRMVDQYGFVTTYQYDAYGNTTSTTRQTLGQLTVQEQQTFDVRSRLLTSQGTIAPSVTNTYDALDRVISQTITDPSGIRDALSVAFTYLPEGQVASVSQTGGTQSFNKQNTYDGLDRLTRVVETPNGAGPFTLEYTYDHNSNLLTETDRRGVTTTRTYDELNFPTSETLSGSFGPSLAVMTATEIDLVGNPVRVKNLFNKETSYDYDGLHRLTKRHVPEGFTEEIAYDANGNTVAEKDRNGRETTMTYDSLNRPATMRDPAGRITTWTYDDSTRTTTIQRDPQGLTERTQSDGLGRIVEYQVKFGSKDYLTTSAYNGRTVQITDARHTVSVRQLSSFGETGQLTVNGVTPAYSVQTAYGPFGGLKRSVDAKGRATTYILDGLNRATLINRPGNFSESLSYDGAGNVLTHSDLAGTVSQMTYDNSGRPLATTVQNDTGAVAVLTIAYQDATSKETRTDARGKITTLEFDGLHRLMTLTNADNKPRSLHYDGMNLLQESDFKGVNTSYVYDAVNRPTQITDRLGQITNIVNSDSGGYQKTVTDRRGNQRVEVYDPLQRLLSITEGGAPLVTYEYDENNNRTATIDGRTNRTTYEYDNLNRVTLIARGAGLQNESFTYDAVGNVTKYNDGAGGDVIQTFDEINHLKTRDDGAGNITNFKYDGAGRLLEKTDPKGPQYQTVYSYNKLGSLKQVNDANGGQWFFDYDPAQNLQSIKDALGRTVIYDYDSLNRLQTITQPQSLITTYTYDANSNRTSVNDPQGHLTSIGYDALDRVQSVNYTNATGTGPRSYSYGYDPEGNLTSVNETTVLGVSSTVTRNYARSYDSRNRLTKTTDPFNHSIRLGYDAANNVSSLFDAEDKETQYGYDALNRLQSVTLPQQAGTINYQWQADGLLKQVAYPAGMRRDYTYDAADRLTNVNNHISATESEEFSYTYDANANRATETRRQNGQTIRNITYGYDLIDRLTSASYTSLGQRPANPPAGQSANYTESIRSTTSGFDKVGNRETSSIQDDITTITLTTDTNGTTTESRQTVHQPKVSMSAQFDQLNRLMRLSSDAAGSVDTTYSYDRNGNLTSTSQNQVTANYEYDCRDQLRKVLNGANQELAAYDYNFDRQRIAKTVGGVSQTYVYGGDQVVNEYGQNNQLLNRYDLGDGNDVLRAELSGEGERYYFGDAQGSITALARTQQSSGSVTARYEYDAWGQYVGSGGASFNSIGYTGQRADSETGLMPLGNGERYYSPAVGSFIQQDSFTGSLNLPASLNRYSYVHDNPVKHTDPSGHIIPLIPILIGIGVAIIVGTGTQRAYTEHNLQGDEQRWASNDPRRSFGSAFGDGTGMTKVVNYATQQDVYTGRDLSLSEARWQGALGAIEVIGNATAIGGLVFKGGSLAVNVARGTEEASQALSGFTRSLSFKPVGSDLRAVGSALRHPIQTGKAVASSVAESYSAIGGARGALKEAWNFTRQEALPRLNPRNYSVEFEGWSLESNVNIGFRGGNATRALSGAPTSGFRTSEGYIGPARQLNPASLEAEIDAAFESAQSRTMFKLPGQDPFSGKGLSKVALPKGDETKPIAYHLNMEFKGISGAPGNKVAVRYHSANPNAPIGTYSRTNPTTQINTITPKRYMLPDGTWKDLSTATDAEKAAAHFP
jgi:RHS repeat-associated protein